jgi:hypothetical protein
MLQGSHFPYLFWYATTYIVPHKIPAKKEEIQKD